MKLTSIIYLIQLRILQLISRKFQLYFFFSAGNIFQEHVNVKTVKSPIPIRQENFHDLLLSEKEKGKITDICLHLSDGK